MAKVSIGGEPAGQVLAKPHKQTPDDETFSFILPSGETVLVGKPRGVLKLKMRDILTEGQFADNEIKEMGRAFLSIRGIDGVQPFMRTPEHFEAMLNRFGSDEQVDVFMGEWQKLTNPVVYGIVEVALKEAITKGLVGDAIGDFVTGRVLEETRKQFEKVKS